MSIAPPVTLRKKQHWDGRLYRTSDMLDVLAVRMGMPKIIYPQSWMFRTLIALQRRKDSGKVTGKGYGRDWKHEDIGVKYDVLSAVAHGKLPSPALQQASELILAAEAEARVLLAAQRMSFRLMLWEKFRRVTAWRISRRLNHSAVAQAAD